MKSKNLTIISRYKEDITWAEKIDGDILIYNKGDDWPWEHIPRVDIENYGREGETFVRAILEFYENLKDYDNVIFLQGSPFDHCKDLFNILSVHQKSKDLIPLSDSLTLESYPDNMYINNFHLSIIDILFQKKDNVFKAPILDERDPEGNTKYENFELFEQSMALCTVLGINYHSEKILISTGAQYKVPVNLILDKSEDWWNILHELFLYYSKQRKIESWTYSLERIWPLIWKHKTLL